MSFSSDLKGELSRIKPERKCDMLAEISGWLRVSGSLQLAGGGAFSIVAETENPAVARHYKKLIKDYFDSSATLGVGESEVPGNRDGYRYLLTITPEEKSSQILRETGMLLIKEGNDYLSDGIYFPIVNRKCCKKAYLRGVFLGCGSISDPKKDYHLEFVLERPQVAADLKKLIGQFVDLSASVTERKGKHVVYIKKADYISDMLALMGAGSAMMDFENIRIVKGQRGETQRRNNVDIANMDRTLSAAEEQIAWIHVIDEKLGLEFLDPALRAVADIRLERPEASLAEIGELLSPPIKKPGVSKRFAKIKELAGELGDLPNRK